MPCLPLLTVMLSCEATFSVPWLVKFMYHSPRWTRSNLCFVDVTCLIVAQPNPALDFLGGHFEILTRSQHFRTADEDTRHKFLYVCVEVRIVLTQTLIFLHEANNLLL